MNVNKLHSRSRNETRWHRSRRNLRVASYLQRLGYWSKLGWLHYVCIVHYVWIDHHSFNRWFAIYFLSQSFHWCVSICRYGLKIVEPWLPSRIFGLHLEYEQLVVLLIQKICCFCFTPVYASLHLSYPIRKLGTQFNHLSCLLG